MRELNCAVDSIWTVFDMLVTVTDGGGGIGILLGEVVHSRKPWWRGVIGIHV